MRNTFISHCAMRPLPPRPALVAHPPVPEHGPHYYHWHGVWFGYLLLYWLLLLPLLRLMYFESSLDSLGNSGTMVGYCECGHEAHNNANVLPIFLFGAIARESPFVFGI